MAGRPGRQRSGDFVTTWGELISGWYKGSDDYLRPIGRSKPRFSLSDERKAVHNAKRWDVEHRADGPSALRSDTVAKMDDGAYQTWASDGRSRQLPEGERLDPDTLSIAVDAERTRIRNLILSNPKQAAIELQIEWLAHGTKVPPKPEFTLEELGAEYITKKRNDDGETLHKKHKENTERAWTEFVKFVSVRYCRDLEKSHFTGYYEHVMSIRDKGKPDDDEPHKMSNSWVRTRFTAVRSILRYGRDVSRDEADYALALTRSEVLVSPSDKPDPRPISPAHFHALYKECAPREKLAMLLGLNFCGHGGEVTGLRWSEIDLTTKSVSCRRSKNGYPRVAHLWDQTVKALTKHRKDNPNHSPYVFVARTGAPMSSESLRQRIVSARKRANKKGAGIPDDVTFESMRDSAYTIGEEADVKHIKFVAGHKTDMSDRYVLRQATNKRVVAVCRAIEKHFFKNK